MEKMKGWAESEEIKKVRSNCGKGENDSKMKWFD